MKKKVYKLLTSHVAIERLADLLLSVTSGNYTEKGLICSKLKQAYDLSPDKIPTDVIVTLGLEDDIIHDNYDPGFPGLPATNLKSSTSHGVQIDVVYVDNENKKRTLALAKALNCEWALSITE
jgi:hypothetical protein